MWETLALPWHACLEEAWTSYGRGSFPIGAAVVSATGRIISRGRNRIFEYEPDGRGLYGHRLAHAELNALTALEQVASVDRLVRLDDGLVDPRSLVLYTTTEPCPLCVGAARMLPVGEIRYAARDAAAGSIDLFDASPFMRRLGMRIVGPECTDLEMIIAALHVEAALRTERGTGVLDYWTGTIPAAVGLGRALHESGELWQMRRMGRSAAEAIDFLGQRVPSAANGERYDERRRIDPPAIDE